MTEYQETEPTAETDTAVRTEPSKKIVPNPSTNNRRFNVQADTLTVHSKRKEKLSSPPVAVKSAVPQKYFSVQIGAYRLKSNADRNFSLTMKRFQQPVIRFYERGIKMERLCVGHFSSAKAALAFLRKIQKDYPADYTDAWVAELKQ
jgi:cell division protein FtsN